MVNTHAKGCILDKKFQGLMMTPDILSKISVVLSSPLSLEMEVTYILSGIRKIIERDELEDEYTYLFFHCNWALHTSMDRGLAKTVLSNFNDAYPHLASGMDIHELPNGNGREIEMISKMEKFREELSKFLKEHHLPDISKGNNWPRFLHLYGHIIEDCPLKIKSSDDQSTVTEVVIKMETANEHPHNQTYYKINWNIIARDGNQGTFFIINSFFDDEERI